MCLSDAAGACVSCSWLQVEVWDRQEVAKQNRSGYLSGGAPRADPLLLLARGVQPKVGVHKTRRMFCLAHIAIAGFGSSLCMLRGEVV